MPLCPLCPMRCTQWKVGAGCGGPVRPLRRPVGEAILCMERKLQKSSRSTRSQTAEVTPLPGGVRRDKI
jgi:hypothetical protein